MYDILVQTFTSVHCLSVCGYFYWLETIFAKKKNPPLLAQKLGRVKLSKSVSGYSKTKKKRKKSGMD